MVVPQSRGSCGWCAISRSKFQQPLCCVFLSNGHLNSVHNSHLRQDCFGSARLGKAIGRRCVFSGCGGWWALSLQSTRVDKEEIGTSRRQTLSRSLQLLNPDHSILLSTTRRATRVFHAPRKKAICSSSESSSASSHEVGYDPGFSAFLVPVLLPVF